MAAEVIIVIPADRLNRRASCGAARAMKPIGPAVATQIAVSTTPYPSIAPRTPNGLLDEALQTAQEATNLHQETVSEHVHIFSSRFPTTLETHERFLDH